MKQNKEHLEALLTLKRGLPVVKPLAKALGVDVARLENVLSDVEALSARHAELAAIPDAFNDLFAERGWIIYEQMNLDVAREAIELARTQGLDAAEARLVSYYSIEEVTRQLRSLKSLKAFQPRMRLALKAAEDYEAGRYHACVPVVLALLDGFVNEANAARRGFFAEGTDLKAWDSIAANDRGLNALKSIFMKGRQATTTGAIFVPYRNGIMHGMDLGYDNAIVAAKAWAALFAVRDWAVRAERDELSKPLPEPAPTLGDVLRQFAQIEEAKRRVAEWKPREIRIGVDVPGRGPLTAYAEQTAERCLYEFLSCWQSRNYGHMARALKQAGGKPVPPAEVRAAFDWRLLNDFEFLSIKDTASAICEIGVRRTIEEFGRVKEDSVTYRMCRVDPLGDPAALGEPDTTWTVVVWRL